MSFKRNSTILIIMIIIHFKGSKTILKNSDFVLLAFGPPPYSFFNVKKYKYNSEFDSPFFFCFYKIFLKCGKNNLNHLLKWKVDMKLYITNQKLWRMKVMESHKCSLLHLFEEQN